MPLRRLEAAIARLEALASSPQRIGVPPGELATITAANARLREAVALSLRQIDALIAQHDPVEPGADEPGLEEAG